MSAVTVNMPLELDASLLRAVRANELTTVEDMDEMNKRIGWLVCAYDVLVEEVRKRCAHGYYSEAT